MFILAEQGRARQHVFAGTNLGMLFEVDDQYFVFIIDVRQQATQRKVVNNLILLNSRPRRTCMNHGQWIQWQIASGRFVVGFFSWPGFCIDYVTIDLLHCGDLGINLYLLASLFIELFTMLGGVMSRCAEGLSELLFYIKLAAKQLGQKRPPINKLTMHMMKGAFENAPKSKLKGSESRHTVHCMNWILEHIFPPQTPYERVRQLCVKSLSEFYASLYVWDNGDIRGRTDALHHGHRFMVFYSELHNSHGPDSVLYRWYPKFHQFQHLLERQVPFQGNPTNFWCYHDESTIGECSKLAEAGHSLTHHREVLKKGRLL